MRFLGNLRRYIGRLIRSINYFYLRRMGVKIGKGTYISLGAKIDVRRGKVIIGDNVDIPSGVCILSHNKSEKRIHGKKLNRDTTIIHSKAFIGVGSIILPGITIGEGAVVGAGSVVTKDVEPNTLVVGNPARKIRDLKPY